MRETSFCLLPCAGDFFFLAWRLQINAQDLPFLLPVGSLHRAAAAEAAPGLCEGFVFLPTPSPPVPPPFAAAVPLVLGLALVSTQPRLQLARQFFGDDGSKMAKAGIPAFAAPVGKAPEPLLWCSSRQVDQPAISMALRSAARPFIA